MKCRKCGRMVGWRMGELCMTCRYEMKKSEKKGKASAGRMAARGETMIRPGGWTGPIVREPSDKPARAKIRIPADKLSEPPFPLARPLHLKPKLDIPFEYEVTPEVQEVRKRRRHVQLVGRVSGSAQRSTDTGREVPVMQEDGGDLSGWEIPEYMSELY